MRTKRAAASGWAMSFADLCLVLLAFFVLMQAQRGDPKRLAAGVRAAFGSGSQAIDQEHLLPAAPLFEAGEAVLTQNARAQLQEMGAQAAAQHAKVRVESIGADRSSARFDGWELGAARVAAVARAIAAGGLDARRIDVSIPTTANTADRSAQQILVTLNATKR